MVSPQLCTRTQQQKKILTGLKMLTVQNATKKQNKLGLRTFSAVLDTPARSGLLGCRVPAQMSPVEGETPPLAR